MSRPVANTPALWREDWPSPDAQTHKYGRGYCTILAAPSLTGATRLASSAASRIGAGLVTVQCNHRGDVYRASLPPEIMVQDRGEALPAKTTVLLGGPGGISDAHRRILYQNPHIPRVIDSGAFADSPERMNVGQNTVLTPHDGEFQRMFGAFQGNRQTAARRAVEQLGCVIVLKGPRTIICHGTGETIINDRPNPNLASAGTGDVLAGMIAGLIAQGMPSFSAACAAVWLHSESAERIGLGLIASDIVAHLPATMQAVFS